MSLKPYDFSPAVTPPNDARKKPLPPVIEMSRRDLPGRLISITGWGGRIRTFEYRLQRPAPYRLATPQHPGARGPHTAHSAGWGGNSYRSRGYSAAATLRAYSRRVSVRVWRDSHPGRARSLAVRLAASARSNRPKTADPEPDMAANVAPASSSDCRIRAIAG